ncbi:MAG: hypothetical protein NVS2B17_29200 [Candidatus Velthaea sp.]
MASSAPYTDLLPIGCGALQPVPTGTANGTPLPPPLPPEGVSRTPSGVRFYIATGQSVTYTVATSRPTGAPAYTVVVPGPSSGPPTVWDENLADAAAIYITAVTGPPLFRYL